MLYGIKDASNLTVISNATSKPILYADYCNTTDISFTSETVYAMVKGVKKIGWDKNREGSFKTSMQVFDLKWISLLMGSDFVTGVTTLNKKEVLSVTGGAATLSATPKAGSLIIYKLDTADNLTHLTEQTVGTPASTADKYSIAGNVNLTFNTTTTFPDNTGKIVAYYLVDSASTAQTFSVKVDKYPSGYSIIGDTTIKSELNVEQIVQFKLGNVKPKSNMTLSFNSDSPSTLDIEWDIFPDANGNMMDFKIY